MAKRKGTCDVHEGVHEEILPTRGETSWCIEFVAESAAIPPAPPTKVTFNEDMISRTDIPLDVFGLVHDLAYDHKGRERFQYRTRAQALLMAPNKVGDCDCPCDICGVGTGKHCGRPPCDQRTAMRINCYTKGHEGGSNCRQCRATAEPLVQDHGPRVDTRRIRLLHDVHGDFPFAHNVVATAGIYHPKINPHGAVSVIASDGKLLGIKPDEFEWIEGAAASQEAERGTEEKG